MDREKIIEALQYMISENCTETQFDYTDDIEAAIAMLKEQEAIEPIRINTNYEQHWKCGNCKAVISVQDKFCHECGQAVKWG